MNAKMKTAGQQDPQKKSNGELSSSGTLDHTGTIRNSKNLNLSQNLSKKISIRISTYNSIQNNNNKT